MLRPREFTERGGDTLQTSRIASFAGWLGIAGLVIFFAAPAMIQLGVLEPFVGFRIFLLGALSGLLALLLGLIGLYLTRASAYREGRGRALLGSVLGALVVGATLASAGPGLGVPPINDITTNPDDPPAFAAALEDPGNQGRDMSYPGADFAAQQRAGYPDLAPIAVSMPPSEVLARVGTLFEANGWRVSRSDPASGTVEGTDTSKIFRFVDDIVVRVRAQGDGSLVDVRSKSRVGRGDVGANAARIRKLRDALTQAQ
jgi:uncharacterized protein (DUF1499 family)